MHEITVLEWVPHYGDVRVALATDATNRLFAGIGTDARDSTLVVLVEIDRVTMLELQRGTVGLYAVLAERCVGTVCEHRIDTHEFPQAPARYRIAEDA